MSQTEQQEQILHSTASEAEEIDGGGVTLLGHTIDQDMSEVFALIEQAAAEAEPSNDSLSMGPNPEQQDDEVFAIFHEAAVLSHPPDLTGGNHEAPQMPPHGPTMNPTSSNPSTVSPLPAASPSEPAQGNNPTSDPPATTEHTFVPSHTSLLDDFDFETFLNQTAPPQADPTFDDVFNGNVFNDLDVSEYIQQHATPPVNQQPSNGVGAEPSNLVASQPANPGPLPAFHEIASFVPVSDAYISGTLGNDTAETAAQAEAPAVEEPEEETESMPVGDSGDALPSAPGIFGSSTNTSELSAGGQAATAVDIPVDILQHHNPQSSNLPLGTMFDFWRSISGKNISGYPPISNLADGHHTRAKRPLKITPELMEQEDCDFQGIHWPRYQVTKAQARQVRRMTYKNFLNIEQRSPNLYQCTEDWGTRRFAKNFHAHSNISILSQTERFFDFRETNTRYIPLWRHYQLRHNVFATGQNAVYHHNGGSGMFELSSSARSWSVQCYNPQSGSSSTVMSPKQCIRSEEIFTPPLTQISSLSASHDVLVVGSVIGVYGLRSLLTSPHDKCTTGTIPSTSTTPNHHPDYTDNSTNHVHTFLPRRSSHPVAVFNSNDHYVRTLDIATNTFISSHRFASPVNCSVTSPCSRLRLLVSDDAVPVVADIDSGAVLSKLPGHTDHGFACAWAPDGVTMATGHQDGILQIWDARNLSAAVTRIAVEQSGIRALQFSPLGGGKPVLVAAEQADFVHIIDADTFSQKQVIEYFGELAGVSITPDGNSLFVGNADAGFGGLMEFSRSLSSSAVHFFSPQRTRLNRDDLNDYMDNIHADELDWPSRMPFSSELAYWDDRPVPKSFPPPYKPQGRGDPVREEALKQKREEKMQNWRQRQGDWFPEEEVAERLGAPDWRHAASRDLRGLGVERLVV